MWKHLIPRLWTLIEEFVWKIFKIARGKGDLFILRFKTQKPTIRQGRLVAQELGKKKSRFTITMCLFGREFSIRLIRLDKLAQTDELIRIFCWYLYLQWIELRCRLLLISDVDIFEYICVNVYRFVQFEYPQLLWFYFFGPHYELRVWLRKTGGVPARRMRRADLLFYSQVFSLNPTSKLRPQQSYRYYGGTDVWGLWTVHFKVARIIFSLMRTAEITTRRRVLHHIFSFQKKTAKAVGKPLVRRFAFFRHGLYRYLQMRPISAYNAIGRPRSARISHYFTHRAFHVRRYTEWQVRKFRGGHGLWNRGRQWPTLMLFDFYRRDFKPVNRFVLMSLFFSLRAMRGFDQSFRIDFSKHADLYRSTWRYRTRRFRTQRINYASRTRRFFRNPGFFPLNLWRYYWENRWETPYLWRRIHKFWWSFAAKHRALDFPWKASWLRHRMHIYVTDKVTDYTFRHKFLRYYDEAHYSYSAGGSFHYNELLSTSVRWSQIRAWWREARGQWNRRRVIQPFHAGWTVYFVSRWWRDRVWAEPIATHAFGFLNGARWMTSRKFHRNFTRTRHVFMPFYHFCFLWVGGSSIRRRYVALDRGRSHSSYVNHRIISNYFKGKYATFGRLLLWGRTSRSRLQTKERLRFFREIFFNDAPKSRSRVFRRYLILYRENSSLRSVLNAFSWVQSGAVFLHFQVPKWSFRDTLIRQNLKLLFYYRWKKRVYNARDRRLFNKFNRLFLRLKIYKYVHSVPSKMMEFPRMFWLLHAIGASDRPFWWLQYRQKQLARLRMLVKHRRFYVQKVRVFYLWWRERGQTWDLETWWPWFPDSDHNSWITYNWSLRKLEKKFLKHRRHFAFWFDDMRAFVFLLSWRRRSVEAACKRKYFRRENVFDFAPTIYTAQLEKKQDQILKPVPWPSRGVQVSFPLLRSWRWKERHVFYRPYCHPTLSELPRYFDIHAGRSDGITGHSRRHVLWYPFTFTMYLLSWSEYIEYYTCDEQWTPEVRAWQVDYFRILLLSNYNHRSGSRRL